MNRSAMKGSASRDVSPNNFGYDPFFKQQVNHRIEKKEIKISDLSKDQNEQQQIRAYYLDQSISTLNTNFQYDPSQKNQFEFIGQGLELKFTCDSCLNDKEVLIVLLYLYDYMKFVYHTQQIKLKDSQTLQFLTLDEIAVNRREKIRVIPEEVQNSPLMIIRPKTIDFVMDNSKTHNTHHQLNHGQSEIPAQMIRLELNNSHDQQIHHMNKSQNMLINQEFNNRNNAANVQQFSQQNQLIRDHSQDRKLQFDNNNGSKSRERQISKNNNEDDLQLLAQKQKIQVIKRFIYLHLKSDRQLLQRETRIFIQNQQRQQDTVKGVVTNNILKTGYAKIVQYIHLPEKTILSSEPTKASDTSFKTFKMLDSSDNLLIKKENHLNKKQGNSDVRAGGSNHYMSKQTTNPLNQIKFAEVMKHSKVDDCWTVVNGFVYDITKILKSHPGGFSQVFQASGKKADKFFQEGHFAVDSRHFLQHYEIGYCDDYF
eukprot:403349226